jgi:GDP-L-fucose synthase
LDRTAVFDFLKKEDPDWVIIAAAKVGGIKANSKYPVEFLSENLQIATNILDGCHDAGTRRVLFLGSSCIYPKNSPQPIHEEYLLGGPLEGTNEAYAIAKIAGVKLVESYAREYAHEWISAMPTNLYGPGDNYDLESSHVLPALLRKFHEAKVANKKSVTLWGSGEPKREFLHADDLASASIHLLENYYGAAPVNIGTGKDIAIKGLAEIVAHTVGFEGDIIWDTSMPDGTMRKVLDVSVISQLGWRPKIQLEDGILSTYSAFKRENTN